MFFLHGVLLLLLINTKPNTRLLSLYTRGLRDNVKRKHLFHIFRKKRYDIILLQETHCTDKDIKIWTSQWGGSLYYSNGNNMARGVITLVRKNVSHKINKQLSDQDGRMLILDIEINNESLVLINVYAPNDDKPEFFTEVMRMAETCNSTEYILSGNLNVALNAQLDRTNSSLNKTKMVDAINRIMEHYDLCDVWRLRNPSLRKYTWRRNPSSTVASRLDYFLISHSLLSRITHCETSNSFGYSDHTMISMHIVQNVSTRGPGYWTFNSKHLYSLEFLNEMNDALDSAIEASFDLPADERWEFIKHQAICGSHKYSLQAAKNKKSKCSQLEQQIATLQNLLDELPFPEPDAVEALTIAINEYQSYVDEKVQASLFRNKCKWFVEGERSSKYYFALERQNYNKKTM